MHYDIVIIGAGPAGSVTALFLARRGYSVVLLDRAAFPRDKVCGDYLTPGAVQLLRDEIGVLPRLLSAGAARVTEQTVMAHDGRCFGGSVDALSCPRMVTDAVLVDAARAAGVDVREGFSVREILFDRDRVVGVEGVDANGDRVSIGATVTAGADGTHSLLARRLGAVRQIPRLHRLALSAYFPGDDPALTMYLPRDHTHACCGFGPAGRTSGTRNVNIVVPVSESKAIAAGRKAYFLNQLQRSFPHAWDRLRDSRMVGPVRSTACFGHRTVRAAFDGAVLVGDAAMFVHPFTGEGVYYALEGARLAAKAIDNALRFGGDLSRYDRDRRRLLAPRYRLCDGIQRIVHSPSALSWLTPRLARSSKLTASILRTVGDVETIYALLTWPNFRELLFESM